MTVDFGFLAVPADASGVADADLYSGLLDSCAFHRDLGYRTAWTIEHHFSPYGMTANPTQVLSYVAGRTQRIELGTMVLVLPTGSLMKRTGWGVSACWVEDGTGYKPVCVLG